MILKSTHTSTEVKDKVLQRDFYSCLENVCDEAPNYDMKTIQGDQH